MGTIKELKVLECPPWADYALLDSGNGQKLERFGAFTFARPEAQALWRRSLSDAEWQEADAVFEPSGEESGGHWRKVRNLPERWEMRYPLSGIEDSFIRFWAMTTAGRHLGLFAEAAAHWEFMVAAIRRAVAPVRVLNLFGYTGLATLAAAVAGAQVTHLDASRKSVNWARQNQDLSGLKDKPIRWIVDDALKFVQREVRRGSKYEGILIEPPKFGRGPKGEVWEVYRSLPQLLQACRELLAPRPVFLVLTVYAVRASGIHLGQTIEQVVRAHPGAIECGELATRETGAAGRLLSQAAFARWESD
jgi:23S rRNA (cytosine1962-C5)-methyltransferase